VLPPTQGPSDAGLRRSDAVPGVVSVIIPAFNAERWIAETIRSASGQTYAPVEVIVADDGSSDATADVAAACGAVVVRSAGTGPGGARNAGLARARGEFIQFLDADDLLAPGKIARQVSVLIASGADVAWEPYNDLVPASEPNAPFVIGARHSPELGADLAASLLTTRGFTQIGSLLIRRSPRTDGSWFEPGREVVEDVRYMVSLAMAGARFVSSESDALGLLFRQHTGPRYSTRPAASFARGCAANAEWAERYWLGHGGLTPARRAALSEAYTFAARQLAAVDPAAFRRVAARGLALGEEFTRRLPARVRWLSRLVGYRRAESIASTWRRVRHGHDRGVSAAAEAR
jgi:glycosyltransferase involved in cell wall biosynthesis